MNTLRIILIIVGIIFVIGIYLYQTQSSIFNSTRKSKKSFLTTVLQWSGYFIVSSMAAIRRLFKPLPEKDISPDDIPRSREQLSNEQIATMSNMVAMKGNAENVDSPTIGNTGSTKDNFDAVSVEHGQPVSVPKGEELLITFSILPKPGSFFAGDDILRACKAAGLQLGEYKIFHRYALVNDKVLMTPVCSLVNMFEPGSFDMDNMANFTTEGLALFMQLPGPVDGREAFKILMDVSEKLGLHLDATICDETRSVLTTQTISHLKEKIENYRFKLRMDSLRHH